MLSPHRGRQVGAAGRLAVALGRRLHVERDVVDEALGEQEAQDVRAGCRSCRA